MIGIISDVHGNYSALCTVLDRLDTLGVSRIICLGDTAGYYSEVNACCDALRERQVLSVMGVIVAIGLLTDGLIFGALERRVRERWGLDRA